MPSGSRRSYILTGLAIVNLAFWIGIGGLVCLLVSDDLDLGVETLVRQGQATAVAVWAQRSDGVGVAATSPVRRSTPASALGQAGFPVESTATPAERREAAGAVATPSPQVSGAESAADSPLSQAHHPWATSVNRAASPARNPSGVGPASGEEGSARATAITTRAQEAATTNSHPATPTPARSVSLPGGTMGADPAPTPRLSNAPLLLADPVFSDLSQLNAEMERSATGRPVQIRYGEGALNQEIAWSLKGLAAADPAFPYRDVHVDMKRDRVIVTGEVTVLTFDVLVQVEGTVIAKACVPQLEIESLSLGGVMTPRFVKGRVEKMVLEAMAWYPADHPLCIEQIVLEEDRATLYGHRR